MKKTDVLIIGAGPIGLFAGFYAGMHGMNTIVVDQLMIPGGQLAALYPEKQIYDVAGFYKIKAKDFIANLLEQFNRFKDINELLLDTKVISIDKQEDGSFIVDTTNSKIHTKAVIIAAGNGGFSPRKFGLENEKEYKNIHYFVDDIKQFEDKVVTIFGGGDSAVDWALMIEPIAKQVNLIHRKDKFSAHDYSVEILKKSGVNIITPCVLDAVESDANKINTLKIKNNITKEISTLKTDEVICNFGFISNLGPIKDWDLDINLNKIKVNSKQQTNIEGIFAIGDVCDYPGKASLIVSGLGEAPTSVNSALQYITPNEKIRIIHSSNIIGGNNDK